MRTLLLDGGMEHIAKLLAGQATAGVNGMYIEYGQTVPESAGVKTPAYFKGLAGSARSGFARVPVQFKSAEDGVATFIAGITAADFTYGAKPSKTAVVTGITLVCMKDEDIANDTLIFTTVPQERTTIGQSVYTSITAQMGFK